MATVKKTNLIGKGKAGPGRPPGKPNKTTALLKDAILQAAERAGKKLHPNRKEGLISYLEEQAIRNPGPFIGLLGKVLPMQIAGEDGGPVIVRILKGGLDD